MKNRERKALGAVLALMLVVGVAFGIAITMPGPTNAAASVVETGDLYDAGWYQTYPVAISWALSTDESFLFTVKKGYGIPIGYRHLTFQDQDLPLGGVAGTSTGVVANKLQHTFIDPEGFGADDLDANQVTVYITEFDGTIATQDSVVSVGEFIFTGINDLFDMDL